MAIEASLEDWVCEVAERHGWLQRKLAWQGRRNAPDRFFARDGRVVLVEAKHPDEPPRPGQAKEIRLLRAAGVEVHVCDSPLEWLRILGVQYKGQSR